MVIDNIDIADDDNLEESDSIDINFNEEDIDETDERITDRSDDFEVLFKSRANKHKLDGKHTLKRDTIFNGKLDDEMDDELSDFDVEESTSNFEESRNIMNFDLDSDDSGVHDKELSEDVNDILATHTSLDFTQNRRKPNRNTFNEYYELCYDNLKTKYSRSEIFVELSYYFTDNTFNMFKLLNKKNATSIIKELKDKGFLSNISNINFI